MSARGTRCVAVIGDHDFTGTRRGGCVEVWLPTGDGGLLLLSSFRSTEPSRHTDGSVGSGETNGVGGGEAVTGVEGGVTAPRGVSGEKALPAAALPIAGGEAQKENSRCIF